MPVPAIDLAILADVIGDDPAKLQRFARKYVEAASAGVAELEAALNAGDINRVREVGHRLKSASRIVGALGAADLCERLEKLPTDDPAAARALIDQLPPVIADISASLDSP